MNNLIGKKFRYKSKYGGCWEDVITRVNPGMTIITGIGEPIGVVKTLKGEFSKYAGYITKEESPNIMSSKGIWLSLDEIELID